MKNHSVQVKSFLKISGILLLLIAAVVIWQLDFFKDQVKAYWLGTVLLAREKCIYKLESIDKVEICLLDSTNQQQAIGKFPPEGTDGDDLFIVAKHTLTNNEAAEFLDNWTKLRVSIDNYAGCHDPTYGFRFFRAGKFLFESGVCWHCDNLTLPTPFERHLYAFSSRSQASSNL